MHYQAQLHQFQREMKEQGRRYALLQEEQQRREELAEQRRAAKRKGFLEQQQLNLERALAAQAKAQEELTQRLLKQMMSKFSGIKSPPQFVEPHPMTAGLPVRLTVSDVFFGSPPGDVIRRI